MKKRVITISREFGSGGRFLGEKLAKELGISYYDKEIIAQIAQKTGLAKEYIEEKGEYAPTKSFFAYAFVGRNADGSSMDDYLYSVQRKLILELAEKEPCVLIGRCADYILRDRKDCIHVFIHGSMDKKVERICELYQMKEAEAVKRIHEVDKKRSSNYRYYTDQKWGYASNYTISLNSSELGYEQCIRILKELYLG